MKNIVPGYKSYAVAVLAIGYGVYHGYQVGDFEQAVNYLLGGGALAAGRATIAKLEDLLGSLKV